MSSDVRLSLRLKPKNVNTRVPGALSFVRAIAIRNSRASRPKFWTTVLPKRNRNSVRAPLELC